MKYVKYDEIIEELGLFPSSEFYEVGDKVVKECIRIIEENGADTNDIVAIIKEHFKEK